MLLNSKYGAFTPQDDNYMVFDNKASVNMLLPQNVSVTLTFELMTLKT